MTDSTSVARSELAPTGTLRVALNMSNFLLTATDPVTGAPCGLAADLGRELGQRLGVPVALLPYPNPGELADAAPSGVWDVGFIGAEPQRAHAIDFTAAYVEIEATYLVPPGSPLQAIADVDRPGIRIAAPDQEALPGSRLLEGRFTAVQQAAGTPKGRPAGARYLCAFIEDIKAIGLVARTIEKHHIRGLTEAAPA